MDAETFQAEALQCQKLLWHVSWSMLSSTDDCADAVQEALARAWKKRDTLKEDGAFRSWLVRILTNICTDMLRQRMRAPSLPLLEDVPCPPAADPLPLREAIAQLSPEHRAVIVLHYLEGFPVKEVARMVGAPEGTVKSRLLYARTRLRDLLGEEID